MSNTLRNIWDSALLRGLVILGALGSAPIIILSMAYGALVGN